jgi:hypothetical protein
VIDVADIELSTSDTRPLDLRMAAETQIGVALRQQLGVDRTVNVVTCGATLTQGRVLENKRPRLLAMAWRTGLGWTAQCEPPGGFKNVASVRVVTLNTVHFLFQNRVVPGQMELSFNGAMTLETGRDVLAWIDDKFVPASTGLNVETSRTVARLAARLVFGEDILQLNPGVRT